MHSSWIQSRAVCVSEQGTGYVWLLMLCVSMCVCVQKKRRPSSPKVILTESGDLITDEKNPEHEHVEPLALEVGDFCG